MVFDPVQTLQLTQTGRDFFPSSSLPKEFFQDDAKQYRTWVFLMRVREELDEWEEVLF